MPSRFLKDIDPSLMLIESEAGIDDKSEDISVPNRPDVCQKFQG